MRILTCNMSCNTCEDNCHNEKDNYDDKFYSQVIGSLKKKPCKQRLFNQTLASITRR